MGRVVDLLSGVDMGWSCFSSPWVVSLVVEVVILAASVLVGLDFIACIATTRRLVLLFRVL